MNANEQEVLKALLDHGGNEDFCFCGFAILMDDTGLDRKTVRRACRSLARKGLAQYGKGLWTCDGDMAGSGYAITGAGRSFTLTSAKEP